MGAITHIYPLYRAYSSGFPMTGYVGIGVHPCLSPELTGKASDDLGALVFETHSSGGLGGKFVFHYVHANFSNSMMVTLEKR